MHHLPVKSYVTCCIPTFHTVALLLCSGTHQSLESRSCMMTFTNFTRNTLRHLLALARVGFGGGELCCNVLQIPKLLLRPAASAAVHVERFSLSRDANRLLSLSSANTAGGSVKETPPRRGLFVCLFWSGPPRSRPCVLLRHRAHYVIPRPR